MSQLAPLAVAAVFLGASFPAEPEPRQAEPSGDVTVLTSVRSAPLGEPVLALAFLDDVRLAVLSPLSVSVHRLDRSRFLLVARREVPASGTAVRTPGGVLLPGDDAFWALTSGMARAVLYALEKDRLAERAQAEALPWPATAGGLRYREGTNLFESPRGLFLTPRVEGLAVDASGRLLSIEDAREPSARSIERPRVGASLAALGGGRVAVSSAAPPGVPDEIEIFERQGDELRRCGSVPVAGSVRALAARRGPTGLRLAAAMETAGGENVVLLLGLRIGGS